MSDRHDSLRDIDALWCRTHSIKPGNNKPAAEFARDVLALAVQAATS
jgi:hypothetical protein